MFAFEEFECDFAVQFGVEGAVDNPHAPFSGEVEEFEMAELGVDGENGLAAWAGDFGEGLEGGDVEEDAAAGAVFGGEKALGLAVLGWARHGAFTKRGLG